MGVGVVMVVVVLLLLLLQLAVVGRKQLEELGLQRLGGHGLLWLFRLARASRRGGRRENVGALERVPPTIAARRRAP